MPQERLRMCVGLRLWIKEQNNRSDEKRRFCHHYHRNWKPIDRRQVHMGAEYIVRLCVPGIKRDLSVDWAVQQEVRRGDKVLTKGDINPVIHLPLLGQKPAHLAVPITVCHEAQKRQEIDNINFLKVKGALLTYDGMCTSQEGLVRTIV